jgi:hypothetical protein
MPISPPIPINIDQNEDKTVIVGFAMGTIAFPLGPISFTGSTAKMEIRQSQDPTSTLFLTLTTGGGGLVLGGPTNMYNATIPCGTIQWTITNAQSKLLPAGTLYYDCVVTTGSGLQTYYLWGDVNVRGTGTR